MLNSPDPVLVQKSIADLAAQTEMLDLMELDRRSRRGRACRRHLRRYATAVVARWIDIYKTLSPEIRRRLVLENDDLRYSAADVLKIHEATGVPLIFDHQHFWCFNPEQLDARPRR